MVDPGLFRPRPATQIFDQGSRAYVSGWLATAVLLVEIKQIVAKMILPKGVKLVVRGIVGVRTRDAEDWD
ncbi:MAG: hypothetical protein ETSY1_04775 [Candidatus Entotheonella factor]|uniref:Uncharacterized protein n=1 Tax=Entotheonella factor TaxID=1429438 RepID=W4LVE5_ENTF1|nr:MAG: hypothetical protein ETSY1_04775 [Candidatus Entotheonella factor]